MGGVAPQSRSPGAAALFDPARQQWTPTASLHVSRQYFTATTLRNGKVLVVGGASGRGLTASAELYDPARGVWTPTGGLHQPRGKHVAALLPDGTVLVAGGQGPNAEPLLSAEIYDPATGTWQVTTETNNIHIDGTATVLADGRVLLAGGDTRAAELYLPQSHQWRPAGNMAVVRRTFTATLLPSGKVLIAGGTNPETSPNTTWATAEVYDPASDSWAATGSMATPRTGQTAIALADGRVLVAGGTAGQTPLASAEMYDPATGSWTTAGSMHQARAGAAATLLKDGQTLVLGGDAEAGSATYELFRPSSPGAAALLLAARSIERTGPDGPARRYFSRTHHQLAGPFLRYWDTHLGAIMLGLPLTEPFHQGAATVQYVERGLLRLVAGRMSLAPLGEELTAARHFPASRSAVAPAFARFYADHRGPELLGAPLAAPDYEMNGDGSGRSYLVQWFERGRLEYHAETPARYSVLPGLVGQQALRLAEHG
jgi:N-acetylneuraminic acid mutarotase